MHFAVQKDILVKALKDVTSALATRVVQPILSNVLIESVNSTTLKFQATDLDLSIETKTTGVVYTNGSITLPGKKLLEIVSKLPNELVSFQVNNETLETSVNCHRSKFSITGLASDDFPKLVDAKNVDGVFMNDPRNSQNAANASLDAAIGDLETAADLIYAAFEEAIESVRLLANAENPA